jgi:hypothetical protein
MSPMVGMPVETPVHQAHMTTRDSSPAQQETQELAALVDERMSHSAQIAVSGCRD